jgi:colanic acid/amylovoran biosynthesis glycosyltransferase
VRILVVAGGFPLRAETFVREQCTGLVEDGHEVTVLASRDGDGTWSARDLAAGLPARTRTARIEAPLARRLALALRRPREAFAALAPSLGWRAVSGQLLACAEALGPDRRFDAIHAQFGPSGRLIELCRAAGLVEGPIATAFYGYDLTRELRISGPRTYARLFANAALLLPNSDYLAGRLREAGAPAARIVTHHLGIDLAAFPFVDRRGRSGPPVALAAGRLVEKKGFEYLIRGLAEAGDRFPGFVRIAGDGPLLGRLESLARELGVADRVAILGWRSPVEVAAEMRDADLLVVPSVTAEDGDMEGLPVVMTEAMATGLPIVGTRHSGIPEAIRDGVNGRLVDERDVAGLAAALAEWSDRDRRLAAAEPSRAIAEAEFDGRALGRRLTGLLASIREGGPSM